ncbi:MAG: hypothetical protein IMF19_04620 [Proteobacteria bacterium]|nr:hypothetical protein [Pseudomonadota bacterium]
MKNAIKEERSIQEQIVLMEDFDLEEEAEVLGYVEDAAGKLFLRIKLKYIKYLKGGIRK